jgi:hypothetical protein
VLSVALQFHLKATKRVVFSTMFTCPIAGHVDRLLAQLKEKIANKMGSSPGCQMID